MNDLILLSGADIPFPQLRTSIHQPKLREISFMLNGENSFYASCGLLNITKNQLELEDKSALDNMTNFEIFMSIMTDKNSFGEKQQEVKMLLTILFPREEVIITERGMFLKEFDSEELKQFDNESFSFLTKSLTKMACLDESTLQEPEGALASKIARKIAEGKRKKAELMGQKGDTKISILNQYASILSIGLGISLNEVMEYTIYQLFDQFERFHLYYENDIYLRAKIAGAKGMKEVDNWMKNIHE